MEHKLDNRSYLGKISLRERCDLLLDAFSQHPSYGLASILEDPQSNECVEFLDLFFLELHGDD